VGDSVWDLLAARRANALAVGLLSGGYGRDELERAGAYRVYEDPADLLRHLGEVGVICINQGQISWGVPSIVIARVARNVGLGSSSSPGIGFFASSLVAPQRSWYGRASNRYTTTTIPIRRLRTPRAARCVLVQGKSPTINCGCARYVHSSSGCEAPLLAGYQDQDMTSFSLFIRLPHLVQ